jgi:hypothetical protein
MTTAEVWKRLDAGEWPSEEAATLYELIYYEDRSWTADEFVQLLGTACFSWPPEKCATALRALANIISDHDPHHDLAYDRRLIAAMRDAADRLHPGSPRLT